MISKSFSHFHDFCYNLSKKKAPAAEYRLDFQHDFHVAHNFHKCLNISSGRRHSGKEEMTCLTWFPYVLRVSYIVHYCSYACVRSHNIYVECLLELGGAVATALSQSLQSSVFYGSIWAKPLAIQPPVVHWLWDRSNIEKRPLSCPEWVKAGCWNRVCPTLPDSMNMAPPL